MQERVNERTRLARDLHDTLLQSFHGLMLRLQAVNKLLPEGKAKNQLEETMERADQAIAEGRNAVYDLRLSTTETNELPEAVNEVGNELSANDEAAFDLVVEGARTLAFVRSRRGAEVAALSAQRLLADVDTELVERVAAYRGGYLPE